MGVSVKSVGMGGACILILLVVIGGFGEVCGGGGVERLVILKE